MEMCGQIHNSATYNPRPEEIPSGTPKQQVTSDTEPVWKIAKKYSTLIHNSVLHDS
jgi:hypothetical protein